MGDMVTAIQKIQQLFDQSWRDMSEAEIDIILRRIDILVTAARDAKAAIAAQVARAAEAKRADQAARAARAERAADAERAARDRAGDGFELVNQEEAVEEERRQHAAEGDRYW